MDYEPFVGLPWDEQSRDALARSIEATNAVIAATRNGSPAVASQFVVEWGFNNVEGFGD